MKSIMEFDTTGMDFNSRMELFRKTEPVKLNTYVFFSGDHTEGPSAVKVTEDNQQIISMFWNSIYFEDMKSAKRANDIARKKYYDYQADAAEGYLAEAM